MTGGVSQMHGGVKFYRGSPTAARSYVEADRSRVDDYYLAEGTGLATRYVASPGIGQGGRMRGCPETAVAEVGILGGPQKGIVSAVGTLDGPGYEQWVAGHDPVTGNAKGRLRTDARGLRFVEVVVNGPKTWSMAAAVHPEIAAAYEAAQDRAASEIIGWLADHATTRVGPRGRQVQVPVERLEAAVIRHYTSRAGDPHRHLHLQVNARVFAAGAWRGLHSVGVVDSIEAINGIGHAAVACDPGFRTTLAEHGYTLDPESGEITELAAYTGEFSARARQITRNVNRYEAQWRSDHPGEEPGPKLRQIWDRRAWSQARPDKVVPTDGADLARRWVEDLYDLGFTPPAVPPAGSESGARLGTAIGRVNRDTAATVVLMRLGARRSAWNSADIRGEVERIVASVDVIAQAGVRHELVEDITTRALDRCVQLLDGDDVPGHVRALTSPRVLEVEADLVHRLVDRAAHPSHPGPRGLVERLVAAHGLDPAQAEAVAVLAGTTPLAVVEGAAGAGKTTTLAATRQALDAQSRRMVVVTPTLKAARVAQEQTGAAACTAAWLIHQHGYRWNSDGHWTRVPAQPEALARLGHRDLLLIDEAGMLDQDAARALLTIADEADAGIAFVGDRHQLPAVGRGGVLDHAARWVTPETRLELDAVHRFTDPDYAALTLDMRTGNHPEHVFDQLLARGQIVIHPTDVERLAVLAETDLDQEHGRGLVIADTREQVADLNAAIRDHRLVSGESAGAGAVTTAAGDIVGQGDLVTTRRNDRDLDVANRDTWTVTGTGTDGALRVTGRRGERTLPADYVRQHVELGFATTVHGAQGDTVDHAHLLIGETTGAARPDSAN